MPRCNAYMSWAAGVGGAVPLLVDGRVVHPVPAPCADWLRYDGWEVVCSTWGDAEGIRLVAIDGRTGATRLLQDGAYNAITAGGGHWGGAQEGSGQWQVDGVPTPLVDPADPQLGNLPVIGFGRDGSIATKMNHATGLVVNGVLWSTALVWDVNIIDAQTGIWQEPSGVRVKGMPMPIMLPGWKNHLRVARVNGQWWPLYLAADANGQLVTHPPDSLIGYAFTLPGAPCDRPDISSDGQYQIAVVWGTAASESVGQIGITRPNIMRDPRYPLVAAPVPPHPPNPEPEPPVSTLPEPAAVKAALERERAKYPPAVTETQMGAILNDAAFQFPDCGMHRKAGQATQPVTGIGISHDVIRYMPAGDPFGWWADVLGASGVGQAIPVAPDWQRSTDGRESFVPAVANGTPPPQPPVGDCPKRVAELEAALRQIRSIADGVL